MNFLSKNKTKTKKGFSIVEMIVAVSILTIAIGAPLTSIVQSLKLARFSATRLEARFLAQEAIEYLKFRKNNNIIDANGFLHTSSNIYTTCNPSYGCGIDPYAVTLPSGMGALGRCDTGNFSPCLVRYSESSACSLSDPSGCERKYSQRQSAAVYPRTSIFTRRVYLFPISNTGGTSVEQSALNDSTNEARIEVRVTWEEDGNLEELVASDTLKSFGCNGRRAEGTPPAPPCE